MLKSDEHATAFVDVLIACFNGDGLSWGACTLDTSGCCCLR